MAASEEWDGVERRQTGELAQVRSELNAVRTALVRVAEGMTVLAPREEVNAAITVERRERRRFSGMLMTFIVVLVVFLIATAFQISQLHRIAQTNKENIARGNEYGFNAVGCLYYSLVEHRYANEFAHHDLATMLGKDFKDPVELSPPSTIEVAKFKNACEKFFGVLSVSPTVDDPQTTATSAPKK